MINKGTVSGTAVLPDGTRMPYRQYVGGEMSGAHPHWQKVRRTRLDIDGGRCVACKRDLSGIGFQTHHLTYDRLGHENLRDVITLCNECHEAFHSAWKYAEYYKEQDDEHWGTYSLEDTAKLCVQYLRMDYWFGGELNCCNQDTCRDLIDTYYADNRIENPVAINPEDIQLYFRNKRYEVLFSEESRGVVLDGTVGETGEAFLDARFGKKGGKGGNKKRGDARAFMTKHKSESFHRNYWCLWHINKLMEETKKYEQAD